MRPRKARAGAAAEGRDAQTTAQLWTVSRAGKFKQRRRAAISAHNVANPHWLIGGSLERVQILSITPTPSADALVPPAVGSIATVVVRRPTATMLRLGCDRCPRQHGPKNSRCSANLFGYTQCTKPNVVYNFATSEPLAETWKKIEDVRMPRARTYTCKFERVN